MKLIAHVIAVLLWQAFAFTATAQEAGALSTAPASVQLPVEHEWLSAQLPLNVIVDARLAPLSFVNKQGQPDGLAIKLLQAFKERFAITFNYHIARNARESAQLIQRYPDAIIAAKLHVPNQSPGEQSSLLLTKAWLETPAVLVMAANILPPTSLHELNGERIALTRYSPLREWLETHFPLLQLEFSDSDEQALSWLSAGEVRGAITNQFTAQFYLNQHSAQQIAVALTLPARIFSASFAVTNNDDRLVSLLNWALYHTHARVQHDLNQHWRAPSLQQNSVAEWLPPLRLLALIFCIILLMTLAAALWLTYVRHTLKSHQVPRRRRSKKFKQLLLRQVECNAILKAHSTFMEIAHQDVHPPLNSLISALESEITCKQDKGQHNDNLMLAYEAARSLQLLASDVCDIFRAEDPLADAEIRLMDLPALLARNVALYRQQAEGRGMTVHLNHEMSTPLVKGAPLILIRILSMLLRHAIQQGVQREINVELCQLTASLKEPIPMVMEVSFSPRYHSVDEPLPLAVPDDTAAMLTTCQQLAHVAGATLKIDMQPQGEMLASLFFFVFPVTPHPTLPQLLDAQPNLVLVVDSYLPSCMLLKQQLNTLGISALTACNGRDALALWQQHRHSLNAVIVECLPQPDVEGMTLSQAIRLAERLQSGAVTPLLGMTLTPSPDIEADGQAEGITACFRRPTTINELRSMLAPYTLKAALLPQS